MRVLAFLLSLAAFGAAEGAQAAQIVAKVDLSEQRMRVYSNGSLVYSWKVSTGTKGFRTPTGSYSAKRLHRMWYSSKYENAPMPHSIFFRGGYAVHGTNHVKRLGRPASHGCVRLAPGNARTLFNMVKATGPSRTRIVIHP